MHGGTSSRYARCQWLRTRTARIVSPGYSVVPCRHLSLMLTTHSDTYTGFALGGAWRQNLEALGLKASTGSACPEVTNRVPSQSTWPITMWSSPLRQLPLACPLAASLILSAVLSGATALIWFSSLSCWCVVWHDNARIRDLPLECNSERYASSSAGC